MAGFREFLTGEVLTAANVNNFLMKQSVMVFADAAARTAALGAEVVEGMLTYNEDTEQLEVFDGSAFVVAAPAPPAGIGSNVVQTVKTNTFSTSSNAYVNVTGLNVVITPSSATSKVLIIAHAVFGGESTAVQYRFNMRFARGATGLGDEMFASSPGTTVVAYQGGFAFLDAPASASAVTYNFQVKSSASQTLFVGRSFVQSAAVRSQIMAIEVAA